MITLEGLSARPTVADMVLNAFSFCMILTAINNGFYELAVITGCFK